jgi:hypothetical protein
MKFLVKALAIILLAAPVFCFLVFNLPGLIVLSAIALAASPFVMKGRRATVTAPYFINVGMPNTAGSNERTQQDHDATYKHAA